MLYGSIAGNIIAGIIFFLYQIIGIIIAMGLLKEEKRAFQILIGSVIGSFSLQWLPALYSFLFGFNQASNLCALATFSLIGMGIASYKKVFSNQTIIRVSNKKENVENLSIEMQEKSVMYQIGNFVKKYAIWILIGILFLYFILVLNTHTLLVKEDGSLYAGQVTYGDMNMHLGFITSIAVQGTFPPEYSIFPGAAISYPFLCDSISSSLYVFGSSLRFAYILPMLVAVLQVFYGFYVFLFEWFKKQSVALTGWILFFFCGGFGFIYFLDGVLSDPSIFTRIFKDFYMTPTNCTDYNLRWVNVIVDMLIPQRASLFGWAMLFPILALLYKSVFQNKKYFLLIGVLIGGMPMIHTHSFLVLGMVCAGWCLCWLWRLTPWNGKITTWVKQYVVFIIVGLLLIMEVIRFYANVIPSNVLMMIPITIIGICVIAGIYGLYHAYKEKKLKEFFESWGVLLLVVLLLAIPQLVTWTFKQASEGSFLQGRFNWVNELDPYIWFYIKNLGFVALLVIPSFVRCRKEDLKIIFPGILLWILAEFIQFQPNSYDNNKILYPAYALLCGVVASYLVEVFTKIKEKKNRIITIVIVFFICTISALLTLGREYVSEYQLYNKNQVAAAEYIEKNAPKDAVILTDTRHNNAISSLTGRNIVCGTGTFLYFHGVGYSDREAQIAKIYENVEESKELLEKYKIDYILVSEYERGSYPNINEEIIKRNYNIVFESEGLMLYAVSERVINK